MTLASELFQNWTNLRTMGVTDRNISMMLASPVCSNTDDFWQKCVRTSNCNRM